MKPTWGEKLRFGGYKFRQEGLISIMVLRVKKKNSKKLAMKALASALTCFPTIWALAAKKLLWQPGCGPEETCSVMHIWSPIFQMLSAARCIVRETRRKGMN